MSSIPISPLHHLLTDPHPYNSPHSLPISPPYPLLEHLQNLLDFTSTLLALFIASTLTLLFLYWSSIYILRKTTGIKSTERIGIWGGVDDQRNPTPKETQNPESHPKTPNKKEVNFASSTSPTESESTKKANEIQRRLSAIQSPTPQEPAAKEKEGNKEVGLGFKSNSEKETIAQIAKATDYEGLGEATGRSVEDIKADVDLEFQRGVRDVGGDVGGERLSGGGGKSYGALGA